MIGKGTMKESNPSELIRETPETQSFLDRMRLENTAPDDSPDSIPAPGEMGGNFSSDAAQDPAADEESRQTHAAMPAEARRALVFLLRQGVILSAQKAKLFEAVCRYETRIRQHLSDVYLTLVLDEKSGVAFIAGMQSEHCQLAGDAVEAREDDVNEDEQYSLISRRVLPLYDTLLLLVLRKYYQSRELCGEQKIIVDIEKIESDLTPFLPLTNSARTDRRKLNGALQKMVSSRILSTVRGSLERFEITPIIRYVVSAEFLESMLKEYERLALEAEPSTAAPDPGIEQP
jgi:hypothetical protein